MCTATLVGWLDGVGAQPEVCRLRAPTPFQAQAQQPVLAPPAASVSPPSTLPPAAPLLTTSPACFHCPCPACRLWPPAQ